jgi:hypothetical protein
MHSYVISCASCLAESAECGDCVMAYLLEPAPSRPVSFSQEEKDALMVMAEVGLIPQLRLVAAGPDQLAA